jgi:hypothetical protein
MAHITHEIHHGLPLEQAKQAAQLALADYLRRYGERGLAARWISDTRAEIEFAAKGAKVQAVVDVLPDVLKVDATIPFILKPFKSMAVSAVDKEAQRFIQQVREGKVA